jgi:hypothetical protein
MTFKNRAGFGFGAVFFLSMWLASPAFAEKVTLVCKAAGGNVTFYYTFDMTAKTVKDGPGTFSIKVTEDEISWRSNGQESAVSPGLFLIYNRRTARLTFYFPLGPETVDCRRAQEGPL